MKKKRRSLGEIGWKGYLILGGIVSFIGGLIAIWSAFPEICTSLCSVFSFLFLCPMSTMNILECPQSVYAGEELNVRVGWNNISSDWQLVVNLEASETNKPTTEIHDRAKVCARFYEGTVPKNVFDTMDINVYPMRLNILNCSPLPIHGGEKLSVRIKWNNLDPNGTLAISLKESETDQRDLAHGGINNIESSDGENPFTLTVYPTDKDHDQAMVRAHAKFYEGTEKKNVNIYAKTDLKVFKSKATVTIINCSPSPVHGGEDLNVKVSWDYIPIGWDLCVSLEESETDFTPLTNPSPSKIKSVKGERTFTIPVDPTERDHDQAQVCARFYNGAEKTNVFDKKDIRVLSSL
jgi:hypothetical protein